MFRQLGCTTRAQTNLGFNSVVLVVVALGVWLDQPKRHTTREREIPQQQQGHKESRLQHTLPTGTLQEKRRKRYPLRELFPTETPHPNAVVSSTNRQNENQRLAPKPQWILVLTSIFFGFARRLMRHSGSVGARARSRDRGRGRQTRYRLSSRVTNWSDGPSFVYTALLFFGMSGSQYMDHNTPANYHR